MSKTITFGLSEWYYLTWLVQDRMNELISKQYKFSDDFIVVEEIELNSFEKDELRKCIELYNSLCEQAGISSRAKNYKNEECT